MFLYIYPHLYTRDTHKAARCNKPKIRQGDAVYTTMVGVKTIAHVRRKCDWDVYVYRIHVCVMRVQRD